MTPKIGIVGWRGMVGSVLMDRMRLNGDFDLIEPLFFSTSNAGGTAPSPDGLHPYLYDATNVEALEPCNAIISCQGGEYTKSVYPRLRASGWNGHWIDAASALRMEDECTIILDPVNRAVIDTALSRGQRCWAGGNCTVSLMMMAIHGLIAEGWVEWISSMTYQAASGGGARHMRELLHQMGSMRDSAKETLADSASSILTVDRQVQEALHSPTHPTEAFRGVSLAGSVIPWIDSQMPNGQSREEWKAAVECNKILGLPTKSTPYIPIDGTCVRVGSMRSHAQALTIKLTGKPSIADIEQVISASNDWVQIVENDRVTTEKELTPQATSGTLNVPIGRLRKLAFGDDYLNAFTVGDQLLWGAAEPLRRMLRILIEQNAL